MPATSNPCGKRARCRLYATNSTNDRATAVSNAAMENQRMTDPDERTTASERLGSIAYGLRASARSAIVWRPQGVARKAGEQREIRVSAWDTVVGYTQSLCECVGWKPPWKKAP